MAVECSAAKLQGLSRNGLKGWEERRKIERKEGEKRQKMTEGGGSKGKVGKEKRENIIQCQPTPGSVS